VHVCNFLNKNSKWTCIDVKVMVLWVKRYVYVFIRDVRMYQRDICMFKRNISIWERDVQKRVVRM